MPHFMSRRIFALHSLVGIASVLLILVGMVGCKATPLPSLTPMASPLRTAVSPLESVASNLPPYVTPTPGKYVDLEKIDPKVYPIIITDLQVYDADHEVVTLVNISDRPIDIGKWGLYNMDANQVFAFPATLLVGPGETIRVHSGKSALVPPGSKTDFSWTDRRVWGPSSDPVDIILVDGAGARRFVRRMLSVK